MMAAMVYVFQWEMNIRRLMPPSIVTVKQQWT